MNVETEKSEGKPEAKVDSRTSPLQSSPPIRLAVGNPGSHPIGFITGSSSLGPPTVAQTLRPTEVSHASSNLPQYSIFSEPRSRVQSSSLKGSSWIEANPKNLRSIRRFTNGMSDFSGTLLSRIFMFCDARVLDQSVVFVCRLWHFLIMQSSQLVRQRFSFEFSGTDYDDRGILKYLRSLGLLGRNPSITQIQGSPPGVILAASYLLKPPASLSNFVSSGVSHFQTEQMPYAWVGIDFSELSVFVTHYTLGSSVEEHAPFPVEWELQGCSGATAAQASWGDYPWVVMDRRKGDFFLKQKSVTFPVRPGPFMRLLRIVQIGRNSQWGLELVASGFEVYGALMRHRSS